MGTSGAPTTMRSARGRSANVSSDGARPARTTTTGSLQAKTDGRDDQPLGDERVHVLAVGRREHVGGGAVLELRAQLLAAGRVGDDVRAGVVGFSKRLRQLRERLLQRRRLEDHQLAARRLGERRARRRG